MGFADSTQHDVGPFIDIKWKCVDIMYLSVVVVSMNGINGKMLFSFVLLMCSRIVHTVYVISVLWISALQHLLMSDLTMSILMFVWVNDDTRYTLQQTDGIIVGRLLVILFFFAAIFNAIFLSSGIWFPVWGLSNRWCGSIPQCRTKVAATISWNTCTAIAFKHEIFFFIYLY